MYQVLNLPNLEIRVRKSDQTVWVSAKDLAYLALSPQLYETMLKSHKSKKKPLYSLLIDETLFIIAEGVSLVIYRMGTQEHTWAINHLDDLSYAIETFASDRRRVRDLNTALADVNEKVKYFYENHYDEEGRLLLPHINPLGVIPVLNHIAMNKETAGKLAERIIKKNGFLEDYLMFLDFEEGTVRTLGVDIEGVEYIPWIESTFK